MAPDYEQHFEEQLWKSQEDEGMELTADEVRLRANKYERQSVRAYWMLLAITPPFLAAFLYNIFTVRELWLLTGQAWALAVFGFIAGRLIRRGPNRILPAEPCAQYLRRELAGKRSGVLWVRRAILLFFPAMLFSWVGNGPLLRAKAMGITSPFWLAMFSGNAPWIGLAVMLGFVWFAFTRELRKIERELEKLSRG